MKNNSQYFEKSYDALSGYIVIVLDFFLLLVALGLDAISTGLAIVPLVLVVLSFPGFFIVNPNGSRVLTLLGKYVGTVKKKWFFLGKSFVWQKESLFKGQKF